MIPVFVFVILTFITCVGVTVCCVFFWSHKASQNTQRLQPQSVITRQPVFVSTGVPGQYQLTQPGQTPAVSSQVETAQGNVYNYNTVAWGGGGAPQQLQQQQFVPGYPATSQQQPLGAGIDQLPTAAEFPKTEEQKLPNAELIQGDAPPAYDSVAQYPNAPLPN